MKKILIFYFAMFVYIASNAQGWIGNSTSNSMYPVNSNLNKTPINIGIGTDAPSEQLHTTLGVRFEGLTKNDSQNRVVVQNATGKLFWRDASTFGGSNNWSLIGNGNATNPGVGRGQNYIGTSTNHRLVFATGGLLFGNPTGAIERMTIMPTSGFIGIGTQTPTSLLTIGNGTSGLGNQANQGYLFKSVGNASNQVEHLGFFNNDQSTSRSEFTLSNSGNNNWEDNFLAFMVHGDSFSNNGINNYYLNQNNSGMAIINAQSNGISSTPLTKFSIGIFNQLPLSFYTDNTERMFIGGNGNVGINTTNPQNTLHIEGGANITLMPMAQAGDNLVFQEPNTGELRSLSPGSTNTFLRGDGTWASIPSAVGNTNNTCSTRNMVPRHTGANTYDCSQIFDNGINIGIGTTNGFNFTTSTWRNTGAPTTGTFKMRVIGNLGATNLYTTSDKNLKIEINSIKNATELISKIDGKTYFWKEDYIKESGAENGRQYGFLAQELEKVVPESVIKDENGRYAVNYNAIIPILTESQKDLIKENESLKSKINVLEQKFELLEKSISLLCESGCAGLEKAKQNATDADVLYQSIPNPTDNEALINFYLSKKYNKASIQINSLEGKSMETIVLDASQGKGSVKIQLGQYAAQTYFYTLIVDNKVVDTKKLTIVR